MIFLPDPAQPDSAPETASDSAEAAFALCCARMRVALERGRSDKLLPLFDYLVERADDAVPPSEAQIAAEVFADGRIAPHRPDANVRVYVHRLRKLIETEFAGDTGPRLQLSVGSYRLSLRDAAQDEAVPAVPDPVVSGSRWRWHPVMPVLLAFIVVTALLGGGLAFMRWRHANGHLLDDAAPWSALADSMRPITVVMGDYYFYVEAAQQTGGASAQKAMSRLVWDRQVPTAEDLIIYQMLNPQSAVTMTDLHHHFVTAGTMTAVAMIRAALLRDPEFAARPIRLIAASKLTPDVLKVSDVVYVGQLSGIGKLLHDPLEQASAFRFDSALDSLQDGQSGRRFQSDGMALHDERIARRDYGYLACLPGPAGNTVLVIAALRDPGLREMVELTTDAGRLRGLRRGRIGCGGGFEALFQVRTLGSANLGAAMVLDRPVKSQGIWDNAAPAPEYRLTGAASSAQ